VRGAGSEWILSYTAAVHANNVFPQP
jgi:hypothetical protein